MLNNNIHVYNTGINMSLSMSLSFTVCNHQAHALASATHHEAFNEADLKMARRFNSLRSSRPVCDGPGALWSAGTTRWRSAKLSHSNTSSETERRQERLEETKEAGRGEVRESLFCQRVSECLERGAFQHLRVPDILVSTASPHRCDKRKLAWSHWNTWS